MVSRFELQQYGAMDCIALLQANNGSAIDAKYSNRDSGNEKTYRNHTQGCEFKPSCRKLRVRY